MRHNFCPDNFLSENFFQSLLYIFIPQAIDQGIQHWTHKGVEDSDYFGFLNSLVSGGLTYMQKRVP